MLYHFVFQHVMTPMQLARMAALVYPLLGDVSNDGIAGGQCGAAHTTAAAACVLRLGSETVRSLRQSLPGIESPLSVT